MNTPTNNYKNPATFATCVTRLLSHFTDKREGLTWIYLLSVADEEGRVTTSINAMALQLDINRKTLLRFIDNLCENGYAAWEKTSGLRQPNLLHLRKWTASNETEDEAMDETRDRTYDGTNERTSERTNDRTSSVASKNLETYCQSDRYKEAENPSGTKEWKNGGTTDETTKREKEQNKEENPPAPPKEEKKQQKEKNTHTIAYAREKNLEQRRQQFLASLLPYHERYGQEMVTLFGDYWTEPNRSMTKMRFELQRTWSTPLRLATWARNDKTFTNNNINNHDKKSRPTSAELIADAQHTAIDETLRFIREAEIRRGGIPPHLPF